MKNIYFAKRRQLEGQRVFLSGHRAFRSGLTAVMMGKELFAMARELFAVARELFAVAREFFSKQVHTLLEGCQFIFCPKFVNSVQQNMGKFVVLKAFSCGALLSTHYVDVEVWAK